MATHELKTWPEHFDLVWCGVKRFEVRKDDRGFALHDVLVLREWSYEEGYSGRWVTGVVTSKLDGGQFGIEPGYCVLGFAPLSEGNERATKEAGR